MIVAEFKYGDPVMMAISVLLASRLFLTGEQIILPSTVVRMNERFRKADKVFHEIGDVIAGQFCWLIELPTYCHH